MTKRLSENCSVSHPWLMWNRGFQPGGNRHPHPRTRELFPSLSSPPASHPGGRDATLHSGHGCLPPQSRSSSKKFSRLISGIAALGIMMGTAFAAEPLYHTDFKDVAIGDTPDDMLVFDGDFEVKEFEGNKVFELPGSPLETYGFLFGPNVIFTDDETKFMTGEKELKGFVVSARAQSARKGRRYPTYSIGVCGVSGYKLRNSPAKRALELIKGEEAVATMSYDWPSGEWTEMKLQITAEAGQWVVKGKTWKTSEKEPTDWQLTHTDSQKPNPGKASAWAAPYSGQPIRFGELKIEAVE